MKIFAHRGSSLLWPENTLFAFHQAAQYEVSGFETDLRLSADHEIILSHDDNLARFGRPDAAISELTAAEIQEIRIYSPDKRHSDTLIKLETLLERYPDKDYIFDCKITDRKLVLFLRELLGKLAFHDRIFFLTWSREMDEHVRNVLPGFRLFPREAAISRWGIATLLGCGRLLEPKNDLLALPPYYLRMPLLRRTQTRALQARGKQV